MSKCPAERNDPVWTSVPARRPLIVMPMPLAEGASASRNGKASTDEPPFHQGGADRAAVGTSSFFVAHAPKKSVSFG
jgi:hypothetical protein